MSALTDLFTAMANKIRSKTGGSDTYTPNEMVSDGIDDVYEAGVAAGTPTLTGNATAADVVSGKTFYNTTTTKQTGSFAADTVNNSATATTSQSTKTPDNGKYFANFTINPQQHSDTYTPAANTAANDMGAVHNKRYVNTSGMIVPSGNKAITANGTGIDVSNFATASVSVSGTPITPSDSNPPAMTSGIMYTPSANGYAYASQITPSSKTETTLWTNSDPTVSFDGQQVKVYRTTMQLYDYIKVEFRLATNDSTTISIIIDSAEFVLGDSSRRYSPVKFGGSYDYVRYFYDYSSSRVAFSNVSTIGSGTGNNAYLIPTKISGIKYT